MKSSATSIRSTIALPSDAAAQPAGCRALDLFCCTLALPVLALLTLLLSVYTRFASRGPVIYRQERIGRQGRRFHILKFRTMKVCADSALHANHFKQLRDSHAPMHKLDAVHDPRLIPGAWLLRATGFDELPQIINILRGDMSLVGPRPCILSEYSLYLPEQRERVQVLPGLTGLWQVSGKNQTTFEEMIRLDIQYVRHVSLALNLKIILLTPWAMMKQSRSTWLSRRGASASRGSRSPLETAAPLAPVLFQTDSTNNPGLSLDLLDRTPAANP
jgi:exopolysaccharide production protein ExoY